MKNIVAVLCLLLVCSSCQNQNSSRTDTPPAELAGRLDAALEMEKGIARDNVLAALATDAAEAGNGEIVLKAIDVIDNGIQRENLYANCSLALAKQGNPAAATEVAKQIENELRREKVLSSIALGDQE